MTAEEWSLLRLFKSLRKLSVSPNIEDADHGFPLVTIDQVLTGLGRCETLIEIQLGQGILLLTSDVERIVHNLPALGCLVLFQARVETLAPLVSAPCLTALELRECTDHEGSPPLWRVTLPSLPLLTDLILIDPEETQLRPNEAEPLNLALLSRMPALSLNRIKQNLLLDDEPADAD